MIEEALMRPGQWELSVMRGTPLEVRRKFEWGGNVVITPTRLPDHDLSAASLYGAAVYTGLIFRKSDELHRFGGPGIMGYIVTGKGSPGAYPLAGTDYPTFPTTFTSTVTTWFSTGAPSNTNGIISGTSYSPTTTLINAAPTSGAYFPPIKSWLDTFAQQTGNEYRFRPDGKVDWGVSTSLYRSTPNVCIMPGGGGREGDLTVLKATRFGVSENIDNFRDSSWYMTQSGSIEGTAAASASTAVRFSDFPGNNPNSYVFYYTNGRVVLNTTSFSDSLAQGNAIADRYCSPQRDYDIEVDEFCIPRFLIPGDWVYAYHPDGDVYDRSNQVQFQGQVLTPRKLRCVGYRWPVQQGMGVYVIPGTPSATVTITDVTDYVAWERGGTKIDVNDTNVVDYLVDNYSRSVIDQ